MCSGGSCEYPGLPVHASAERRFKEARLGARTRQGDILTHLQIITPYQLLCEKHLFSKSCRMLITAGRACTRNTIWGFFFHFYADERRKRVKLAIRCEHPESLGCKSLISNSISF